MRKKKDEQNDRDLCACFTYAGEVFTCDKCFFAAMMKKAEDEGADNVQC